MKKKKKCFGVSFESHLKEQLKDPVFKKLFLIEKKKLKELIRKRGRAV